jgi:hypothetical protein
MRMSEKRVKYASATEVPSTSSGQAQRTQRNQYLVERNCGLLKKSIVSAKIGGWALFFVSLRGVWYV